MDSRSAPTPTQAALRVLAEFAGFTVLLFFSRFVLRSHLIPHLDEECTIGGIAADVLRHGVRFPFLTYAPNEYENGLFFSGLLTAVSFSILGRNVLALKLVTHLILSAGAVGALWLLRSCLDEIGLTGRRVRWAATAALVLAIALAPPVITFFSMCSVGIGSHFEGSALDTILLAVFSRRLHTRSAARTAALWAAIGLALFLYKGTLLLVPLFVLAECALSWRAPRRLAAAAVGFVVGQLPEVLLAAQRHTTGWSWVAGKAQWNAQMFPNAFIDSMATLADHRIELLVAWALALGVGLFWLRRRVASFRRTGTSPPIALGLVVGVACLHLAVLTVMAQGSVDYYVVPAYPSMAVLFAVMIGSACAYRVDERIGPWIAAAMVMLAVVLYRPETLTWGAGTLAALWRNERGAVCSWRLAEGFKREYVYGVESSGGSCDEHVIARCRSLSDEAQVLDCIGGIARERHIRVQSGDSQPPAGLTPTELRAFAYYHGIRRGGDTAPCRDFSDPVLAADCEAAVQLECLVFADIGAGYASGHGLARPHCAIGEPPINGVWMALRENLLARADDGTRAGARDVGDDRGRCQPLFDACY